jgi:hypothetical protein
MIAGRRWVCLWMLALAVCGGCHRSTAGGEGQPTWMTASDWDNASSPNDCLTSLERPPAPSDFLGGASLPRGSSLVVRALQRSSWTNKSRDIVAWKDDSGWSIIQTDTDEYRQRATRTYRAPNKLAAILDAAILNMGERCIGASKACMDCGTIWIAVGTATSQRLVEQSIDPMGFGDLSQILCAGLKASWSAGSVPVGPCAATSFHRPLSEPYI